jgi:hypothetical protein
MTGELERKLSWEDLDLGKWTLDQSVRLEVAEELMGLLCGWSGEQLRIEQDRENPDPDQVQRLLTQHEDHLARRRELSTLDDASIKRMLDEYGPLARRVLGRE